MGEGAIVHLPVMPAETICSLRLRPGTVVIDGTVGGGGHASMIAEALGPTGRLVGIDADPEAVARTRGTLEKYGARVGVVQGNFRALGDILAREGIVAPDAVLLDLGVSSYQFDDGARGFSLRFDGPLDMRMDTSADVTAADLVNRLSEEELDDIINRYGEERYHRRAASAIIEARAEKRIETTTELAAILRRVLGRRYGRQRIDAATRTFQALRIAVNDELGALEEGLQEAIRVVKKGGRIVIISFHSLEDRIVKWAFRKAKADGLVEIITKKPIVPSPEEMDRNPRSRSAKLRVAERV